jgi:hypothetical protein
MAEVVRLGGSHGANRIAGVARIAHSRILDGVAME